MSFAPLWIPTQGMCSFSLNENEGGKVRAEHSSLAALKGRVGVCPRTQHLFSGKGQLGSVSGLSLSHRPCPDDPCCSYSIVGMDSIQMMHIVMFKENLIYGIGLTFTYLSYVIKYYSLGFFSVT